MYALLSASTALNAPKQIFNRVMAPYLENLDMNQVNYGITSGQHTRRSGGAEQLIANDEQAH